MKRAVINSTCPTDWPSVLQLASADPRMIAAIGLHPWQVNGAAADWQVRFLHALDSGVRAIGEIGLDQWIEDCDIERQQTAFRWQLAQATARNLPASIHCLKAIGPLMETLRAVRLPSRGIHLHAYNGPVELIPELVELGAFFSFNGGQLKPKAKTIREAIRAVPYERLLIETDAPDMPPPAELREFELSPGADGLARTHPANIRSTYAAIAALRGITTEALAKQVEMNFLKYFPHC